jgi:hypothetical protein
LGVSARIAAALSGHIASERSKSDNVCDFGPCRRKVIYGFSNRLPDCIVLRPFVQMLAQRRVCSHPHFPRLRAAQQLFMRLQPRCSYFFAADDN